MGSEDGRRTHAIGVPSSDDPLLRTLVEGAGGPLGRHAAPGRTAPRWFTVPRVIIILTVASALLAVLVKNPCREVGWSAPTYFYRACYSDWTELYQSRGFGEGTLPFITPGALFEYPVLLGLLASGTAVLVDALAADQEPGARSLLYFDVNAVLLTGVWILTALATLRLAPRRPWDAAIVATAPVIILSGTINWDLWAVLLATAGMLAFARERPLLAGVLWGLGAAVKIYPVLLVGAVIVLALRTGRYRPLVLTVLGAAGAWLVVNVPFAFRDLDAWGYFLTFTEDRDAGFSSAWYVINAYAERLGTGGISPDRMNAFAGILFLLACGGVAALALAAPRRPRLAQLALLIVGAFLLCNKVYSPQYALWLVPLVALAVPRWRVVLVWQFVEVLHWWAVWMYLGGRTSGGPAENNLGLGVYAIAVVAHLLATAWVMGAVVREVLEPDLDVVRADGDDDPQGGAFDGAADRLRLGRPREARNDGIRPTVPGRTTRLGLTDASASPRRPAEDHQ